MSIAKNQRIHALWGKIIKILLNNNQKQGLEQYVEPRVCTRAQGHMPKAGGLGGFMEEHTRNQEEGGWD